MAPDDRSNTDVQSSSRKIDVVSATSLVAASMIGAGVFTTSGFSLGALSSPWWVMAAWAVAGIIAICGAICYGALASHFTESGGEYLFLSRSLHPVAGMMAGWISLLAGFTGAIAIAATAFAEYLMPVWTENPGGYTANSIAIATIIAAAVLHSIGVRPGARAQDVVVGLKFLLIVAFVAIALVSFFQSSSEIAPVDQPVTSVDENKDVPWFGFTFATQLMWISFSFCGFNAAVYVAGEVVDPERNVRRAIIGGTVMVTIAYFLLNAVFVFATPLEKIVGQEQVATISAGAIGGEAFEGFARVVILMCLFTSVSAMMMSGPRVYSKMADDECT